MGNAILWSDLLDVYNNSIWKDGGQADVIIQSEGMIDLFKLVEQSDKAQSDANLNALVDLSELAVGRTVRARIGPPRLALGILADDWAVFLSSPEALICEPKAYFIKSDGVHSGMNAPPRRLLDYRAMLEFVSYLRSAALFLDIQRQVLVYFKDEKTEIPVRISEKELGTIDLSGIETLGAALSVDLHGEQRLAIFEDAILTLARSQPPEQRFLYLAQNAKELGNRVESGYRLFASSFSYSKIRGEVEVAQSEYISRIHKTFVDIQGQLLGLPVASVVIASQLKAVKVCGSEVWANIAILVGAWLFVGLLAASCMNQWFTLNAIAADIGRQQRKMDSSFKEVSGQFSPIFRGLKKRICWHHAVLAAIVLFAVGGAVFATVIFRHLTAVDVGTCAI